MGQEPHKEDKPASKSPSESSLASSSALGRIVLISLGILGLGLAIAFIGFYYVQNSSFHQKTVYPSNQAQKK